MRANQHHQLLHLEKDGEVDDGYGGSDEERLMGYFVLVDEQHERKRNGSSQAAVRHDKLLDVIQLVQPEAVGHFRQNNHAWNTHNQFVNKQTNQRIKLS